MLAPRALGRGGLEAVPAHARGRVCRNSLGVVCLSQVGYPRTPPPPFGFQEGLRPPNPLPPTFIPWPRALPSEGLDPNEDVDLESSMLPCGGGAHHGRWETPGVPFWRPLRHRKVVVFCAFPRVSPFITLGRIVSLWRKFPFTYILRRNPSATWSPPFLPYICGLLYGD